MKLSRLGAGTSLAIVVFIASLVSMQGACTADYQEPCGVNGVKNGTCQLGTCPSGTTAIDISDPSDSCPASNDPTTAYTCCVPSESGGASSGASPADAGHAG